MDGCDGGVEAVFVSLPVRHSKSEADKVILRAVHHQAADSFMASRLAVRAADYNERGRRGETGERRGRRGRREGTSRKVFGNDILYLLTSDG